MLYFNLNKNNCTGCSACASICPRNCITMEADPLGYKYPTIIDLSLCVHCGMCERICPQMHVEILQNRNNEQIVVAAIHKNYKIWDLSSSGGAFTAICEVFGDEETVVFGAKFDGIKVVHDYVVGINNIGVFRKSKYIQSDLHDSFVLAKRFLKDNVKVIFSGTACQIAGLKAFLNKDYNNLLCVDVVCQSVGSPSVFEAYIRRLEELKKNKIVSYSFRYKKEKWGRMEEYISKIEFSNEIVMKSYDLYTRSFISMLHVPESCLHCKYKTKNRVSDITLADFKKRVMVFPKQRDIRNLSTIIFNTLKGRSVYEKLSSYMNVYPVSMSIIEKNLILLTKNYEENPNRKMFIDRFLANEDILSLMEKYNNKESVHLKIWKLLPERIRFILKRR